MRSFVLAIAVAVAPSCSHAKPTPPPIVLANDRVRVEIALAPLRLSVQDSAGNVVLTSLGGATPDGYAPIAATVDAPAFAARVLPGWDGYAANEAPWRTSTTATATNVTGDSADLVLGGISARLHVALAGARVKLRLECDDANKTTMAFASADDEHFFGLGERYASIDHRGLALYSWAEEGALGQGENAPRSDTNPYPNGPSMTYFPVPFFLSTHGYGMHVATTYRSEMHLASERPDAWRFAVGAASFDAVVYVGDPLAILADYTEDTGRPMVPAPWVFGARRRVGVNAMVGGVPEIQKMRDADVAITGVDDATHFLPALSHVGREDELRAWTSALHASGYKALAYNNPYVSADPGNAEADYAFGKDHGYFVKHADGTPHVTQFISGKLVSVSPVDVTNPDAVAWLQSLLKRTLDFGYDGWMHDFGEYTPRDAVMFDGTRGDEAHNRYPVLSAKAAHDLLERERPGDYLFFVRSGGAGTQAFAPAVWGGDAEATFDETLGLPSSLRGGVSLSMTGVPYWGSDATGFKCITDAPHDKEVFLRWIELAAVSPIMMEQNACANPIQGTLPKWSIWSDDETTKVYAKHARTHTRLLPYFTALAREAHKSGRPLTMHPFLLFPREPAAWSVDDAFFLGPSLYATPVVRRGQTSKVGWLPPGRYVDLDDYRVYEGARVATIPAPLAKLPLLIVENHLVPMLDPTIDTLAPSSDPMVVTPANVADRLDVVVALGATGTATMTLDDGTTLTAKRIATNAGNPDALTPVTADRLPACSACYFADVAGDVQRIRANGTAAVRIEDVELAVSGGPPRRVRWEVLRL